VVGGGNVAMDCVRSSLRLNKPDVNLVYRRTKFEMPADHLEVKEAEEELVNFHYLTNPINIIAENNKVVGVECVKMELGEEDESGRRRPVPIEGSQFILDCDIVVSAIGQTIDLLLLNSIDDISTTLWNTISVNEFTKQTNHPSIFSSGDCEMGPTTLIAACASGYAAAVNINKFINGETLGPVDDDHFNNFFRQVKLFDPDEEIGIPGGKQRCKINMLPPETRKKSFNEVEKGFTNEEAMTEASRCLKCYRIVTIAL